jgi:hypothetical protein
MDYAHDAHDAEGSNYSRFSTQLYHNLF